jgi:hypothetical protein
LKSPVNDARGGNRVTGRDLPHGGAIAVYEFGAKFDRDG